MHTDAVTLGVAAADVIARAIRAAVDQRGACAVAFSGGRGPAEMLGALAQRQVPWARVHVLQVDERAAPRGHAERNLTLLQSALLDRVPLPADHVHPMPVEDGDLDAAALAYARVLDDVCGGRLDLVHLGLGGDGHTASWPPGHNVVDSPGEVAATGVFNGYRRLTLTPRAVAAAAGIVWLVSGAEKRSALTRLLVGDASIPAAAVPRERALVLADRHASPDPGQFTA